MSLQEPTYYEILGLPPAATPDDIKRRYRELARRCHPDVSHTPDSANRFREINEANSVLSDAGKRANYDARLKLAELKRKRVADGGSQAADRRPPNNPATQGSRKPPTTDRQRPNDPSTQRPNGDEVGAILQEAQKAMSRLKYREAELLCRRANRIRRTSLSYEILGDVFRTRGRTDDAVAMYSYAIQLDRANRDAQMKFDRLVGQPSGATMAGNAARASRSARPSPRSPRSSNTTAPSAARKAATIVGAVMIGVLIFSATRLGSPATTPWFFDWDAALLVALAGSGAMAGFLLALNEHLPSARDELFAAGPRNGRAASIAVGPLVIAFALLSFYAALLVFLVVGFLCDRLSKPVMLAFAVSFALTIAFALANAAGAQWTLLSGGNVVLVFLLAGWGVGSGLGRSLRL